MAESDETTARRLRAIADILGIPVDTFYGGEASRKLADTAECTRLWDLLRTDEGRARVLDCLREALAKEGA